MPHDVMVAASFASGAPVLESSFIGNSKWADLDRAPRIEAVIAATVAGLARDWQLYFTSYTGELPTRELPAFDEDTGEPLELLNRDNTDQDKVRQLFDNLKWVGLGGTAFDFRDDMLLALATGTKSGVLAIRMPARLYYWGMLDEWATKHDKPLLMPTSFGDGYFNFVYKWPTGKVIPKNIKIKYADGEIEILGDGDKLLLPPTIGHWCDKNLDETNVVPEIPEMEAWVQTLFGIKNQDDETTVVPEISEMPPSWLQEELEIKDYEKNHKQFYDDGDDALVDDEKNSKKKGIALKDFIAYLPLHGYIFIPTRELWPATSVNARIKPITFKNRDGTPLLDEKGKPVKMAASLWLDKHHAAAQMTWCPGEKMEIHNRLVNDGGWFEHKGATTFNLYRPPIIVHGDAANVGPWLNHIKKIYPKDAEHILNWMAHPVQHPEIKINHALLLGGLQGIGKDTMLEPLKRAVGPWNFKEVSPSDLMGRFNGFLKSVVLRVNEVRDLGELSRFNFYEKMKPYTASPPDVHRVDEKNLKEHDVFNVNATVETTNHKLDGIYLPADDRRTYVAWSDCTKDDFDEAYWNEIWGFYNHGGDQNIAAYLAQRDLSGFNPKAPPFKTEAWHAIVGSNIAPEESELSDAIELLKNPEVPEGAAPIALDALTLAMIETVANQVSDNLYAYLNDPKNARAIPHKLAGLGYTAVVNPDSKNRSTRWRIGNGQLSVQRAIYAKDTLNEGERIAAARKVVAADGKAV
jgi:hypothetical protein